MSENQFPPISGSVSGSDPGSPSVLESGSLFDSLFDSGAECGALLAAAAALLRDGGLEEPAREAAAILRHCGVDPVLVGDGVVPAEVAQAVGAVAARRAAGEPLAYITGAKGFWSFDLAVSPDVLIPRPETEHVVEAALACLPDLTCSPDGGGADAPHPPRILDLGVGSGAIVLALLRERPDAWGLGVDRSVDALGIARANAQALGLSGRASFVCADWDDALTLCGDGGRAGHGSLRGDGFDLIVSNPPYIPTGDIENLQRDVRAFEPLMALDGGADGLVFYRRLARSAAHMLRPGGAVVAEFGCGQHDAVGAIFAAEGLTRLHFVRDLADIIRVVVGEWPG